MVRSIPLFYPACFQDFFLPCPFPENVNTWSSEFNIQKWARATPPNLVCTNGSVQFFAHREVLSLVSTFFESALQHDQTCTVVSMTSVSDEAMEFIYKCIYGNPHTPERNPEFETISHSLYKSLYMAYIKYDLCFISDILSEWCMYTYWIGNVQRFALTYNFLVSMNAKRNENGLFLDFLRSFLLYWMFRAQHLQMLPNDVIKDMLQDNIDCCWYDGCLEKEHSVHFCTWRFFQEVISYAKNTENACLLHFARDILPRCQTKKILLKFLFVKQCVLMQMLREEGPFNGDVENDKDAIQILML